MDPNEALRRIRGVVQRIGDDASARTLDAFSELEEITDAAQALDEWLSKGGFLPDGWRNAWGVPEDTRHVHAGCPLDCDKR